MSLVTMCHWDLCIGSSTTKEAYDVASINLFMTIVGNDINKEVCWPFECVNKGHSNALANLKTSTTINFGNFRCISLEYLITYGSTKLINDQCPMDFLHICLHIVNECVEGGA